MAYFYKIVTSGNQPKFDEVAQRHTNALNNYLVYGMAMETDPAAVDPMRPKLSKQKEVRHMTTVQTIEHMTIYTTTHLCCEDDQV
jgi:hypothetical protein